MGLPSLNFAKFVLDFPFEEGGDDDDSEDIHDENEPVGERPVRHQFSTSNWGSDVDVHVPSRFADAPQACAFLDQKVVQPGRQFLGQGHLAKN
jgi:hypothetical protein